MKLACLPGEIKSLQQSLLQMQGTVSALQDQSLAMADQISDLESQLEVESKRIWVQVNAEQNGAISTNRMNFSFGNGNEQASPFVDANGWGWVAHFPGIVRSLSLGTRSRNTADTEVGLLVNNVDSGASVTLVGSTVFTGCIEVNVPFVQHDVINFFTAQVGGGNDVVVSALLEMTLP